LLLDFVVAAARDASALLFDGVGVVGVLLHDFGEGLARFERGVRLVDTRLRLVLVLLDGDENARGVDLLEHQAHLLVGRVILLAQALEELVVHDAHPKQQFGRFGEDLLAHAPERCAALFERLVESAVIPFALREQLLTQHVQLRLDILFLRGFDFGAGGGVALLFQLQRHRQLVGEVLRRLVAHLNLRAVLAGKVALSLQVHQAHQLRLGDHYIADLQHGLIQASPPPRCIGAPGGIAKKITMLPDN
jgi:hypothetical protein